MPPIRTHYDNLKVARNAPDAVIRTSYEALIQSFQDMEPKEAQFFTKVINESYDVLSQPIRRSVYDRWIEEQENPQQEETPFQQPEVIESVASFEYAGFWHRAFAHIIDVIAINTIGTIAIIIIFGGIMPFFEVWFDVLLENNPILWIAASLTSIVLLVVLPVIMFKSSNWQVSIGKKLLGLKIIDISGNKISFGQAIGRLFLKIVSMYTIIFFVISCFMIIFSDKKQGLYDKITDTLVVINPTPSLTRKVFIFGLWLIVVATFFVALVTHSH